MPDSLWARISEPAVKAAGLFCVYPAASGLSKNLPAHCRVGLSGSHGQVQKGASAAARPGPGMGAARLVCVSHCRPGKGDPLP